MVVLQAELRRMSHYSSLRVIELCKSSEAERDHHMNARYPTYMRCSAMLLHMFCDLSPYAMSSIHITVSMQPPSCHLTLEEKTCSIFYISPASSQRINRLIPREPQRNKLIYRFLWESRLSSLLRRRTSCRSRRRGSS